MRVPKFDSPTGEQPALKTPATFCGHVEKRPAFCRVPFSQSLPPDLVALGENNKAKGKGVYLSPLGDLLLKFLKVERKQQRSEAAGGNK